MSRKAKSSSSVAGKRSTVRSAGSARGFSRTSCRSAHTPGAGVVANHSSPGAPRGRLGGALCPGPVPAHAPRATVTSPGDAEHEQEGTRRGAPAGHAPGPSGWGWGRSGPGRKGGGPLPVSLAALVAPEDVVLQPQLLVAELHRVEVVVVALLAQQLGVGAPLDDLPVVQHHDLGRRLDGGEAVGDDEAGAPLHEHVQGPLDQLLGRGVHAGGGLVQDQDARVGDEGPGEGEQLALAPGRGCCPRSCTSVS